MANDNDDLHDDAEIVVTARNNDGGGGGGGGWFSTGNAATGLSDSFQFYFGNVGRGDFAPELEGGPLIEPAPQEPPVEELPEIVVTAPKLPTPPYDVEAAQKAINEFLSLYQEFEIPLSYRFYIESGEEKTLRLDIVRPDDFEIDSYTITPDSAFKATIPSDQIPPDPEIPFRHIYPNDDWFTEPMLWI